MIHMDTITKLTRNVMYGVKCKIPSEDGASHINARATLSNRRTVKGNGGNLCIKFFVGKYYLPKKISAQWG